MNNSITVYPSQWRLKPLISLHLVAIALLASFVFPAGHAIWRELDSAIFFTLNGTLADGGSWTRFWAYMNMRAGDTVPAVLMLIALTFPGFGFRREQLQQAITGFLVLLTLSYPVREILYQVAGSYGLSGKSASLVLEPSYRLNSLAPDIPAKDHAYSSFPGDHATVLICWAGFIALNNRAKAAAGAILVALFFMLPRIIGGAHWFTDNFVGGMFVALITLAWAFYSPVFSWCTRQAMRAMTPFYRLCGKLPLIGLLPFFAATRDQSSKD